MSYDIWLETDLGGPEPIIVADPGWNYTSNCARMWRTAGADLAEYNDKPAGECLPSLRAAITEMTANPAKYLPMEPLNGWGSYKGVTAKLVELVTMFEAAPKATVRVYR